MAGSGKPESAQCQEVGRNDGTVETATKRGEQNALAAEVNKGCLTRDARDPWRRVTELRLFPPCHLNDTRSGANLITDTDLDGQSVSMGVAGESDRTKGDATHDKCERHRSDDGEYSHNCLAPTHLKSGPTVATGVLPSLRGA